MKYVGMTSRNPYIRKQEWENEGRRVSNFVIIQIGLTYSEAQKLENEYKIHGYQAEPGGPVVHGAVYSIYTYEY